MDANIANRISFWELMADTKIVIPTIQRDYTYGAGMPATDKVLNHLLSDMYRALFEDVEPLALDFIYGVKGEAGKFVPLDGQQRLTTLFLLHLYAMPQNEVSEVERERFRSFSYETRESTTDFCERLTTQFRFQFEQGSKMPSQQIRNEAFFLPSFSDDPTICSMLVVLDRIHSVFGDRRSELWALLTADDCRIQFDALDFGKYRMSDDLYIKMNARGKPLTEFEIFKSKFEKHVSPFYNEDVDRFREISCKLDVEWSDLVLEAVKGDVKRIDTAFVNLFKNILSIIYWRHPTEDKDPGVKSGLSVDIVRDRGDVDFIESFLNAFASAGDLKSLWGRVFFSSNLPLGTDPQANEGVEDRIRLNKLKGEVFDAACSDVLPDTKLLLLYGWYLWVKAGAQPDVSALRHLRNLIENSEHEIRAERMQHLVGLVDAIFEGRFLDDGAEQGVNRNQWIEECAKAKDRQ